MYVKLVNFKCLLYYITNVNNFLLSIDFIECAELTNNFVCPRRKATTFGLRRPKTFQDVDNIGGPWWWWVVTLIILEFFTFCNSHRLGTDHVSWKYFTAAEFLVMSSTKLQKYLLKVSLYVSISWNIILDILHKKNKK